ncbi:hypothetical protein CANCADRAFT_42935 [Tortispora caseinolytica NRRL Y-17796]|uniref:Ferroxidase n=1 Tax=Tortispora caseinolytica NRRL Y-17796 TaxID=767744 RepID=A0A1E4TKP0_9ASCO|nr:hypothetical protein CANCADRAFT_42935 [Tortispora caseinolytica NRRL Y-17796]
MLAKSLVIAGLFAVSALAETHEYHWTSEWVYANPDGMCNRPVIGINGVWPPPVIEVTKGDRIVLYYTNGLGNETSSIHFHGLFQTGSNTMDGPPGLTQCPIAPGQTMLYNFTVPDQSGTYWWHSHTEGQYPDGIRAALIINDPEDPYADMYEEAFTLTISEWYHDLVSDLVKSFISVANPTGAEPIPDSGLINDSQNVTYSLKPNTTYKFRIINYGAFVSQYIWFEGHNMTIIEVDGVDVEPYESEMIYITVAQRYSVLITTKSEEELVKLNQAVFPFVTSIDLDMLDTLPDTLNWNTTGWLVYETDAVDNSTRPDPALLDGSFDDLNWTDDFYLTPLVVQDLITDDEVDQTITVNVTMQTRGNGANYAFFNNISYLEPVVPILYTLFSAPEDLITDSRIYGSTTHSFVLEYNKTAQIVLNNQDPGKHPFHLHGHQYQLVERSEASDDDSVFITYDPDSPGEQRPNPVRRDTAYVRPNGYMVIRWHNDNPGVWFFHCHIEWHIIQGLSMVIVEAPEQIRATQSLTQNHLDVCKGGGYPTEGNAAGNTADYFNLTGEPQDVPELPAGFTAKGYVAMVFSCVAAFLGMACITWYGVSDIKTTRRRLEARVIKREGLDAILGDEELERDLINDAGVEPSSPLLSGRNSRDSNVSRRDV